MKLVKGIGVKESEGLHPFLDESSLYKRSNLFHSDDSFDRFHSNSFDNTKSLFLTIILRTLKQQ